MENPRDGRAWWAAVYGVAQSRTWLKQLSSSRAQPVFSVLAPVTSFHVPILPPHWVTCGFLWKLNYEAFKATREVYSLIHSFTQHCCVHMLCQGTVSGMKMWWWWYIRLCLLHSRWQCRQVRSLNSFLTWHLKQTCPVACRSKRTRVSWLTSQKAAKRGCLQSRRAPRDGIRFEFAHTRRTCWSLPNTPRRRPGDGIPTGQISTVELLCLIKTHQHF